MLTNVPHFSVNVKGVHKIWHKSMNRKRRNRSLKQYHFFTYWYKQHFKGAGILMSSTCHWWINNNKQRRLAKNIKFLLNLCVKKGSWSEIVYQRVYEQKVVSVICEEVAAKDWSSGTLDHKNDGLKQIRTSLSCQ